MNVGDYAEIINDPIAPLLNGMAGKITKIFDFQGHDVYEIVAENYGPYVSSTLKIRAWLPGNRRTLRREFIDYIRD